MTNEEAKAIIRKEYLCVDRDCDIEKSCGRCDLMIPSKEPILEAYKIAMDAIKAIPSAEPKWIPVSERLPKDDGLYLVYTEEQPFVCPFEDGEFFIDEVLAWMPLPSPYQPQERSDKE